LPAQSHELRVGSIGEKQDRDRYARREALEVNPLAFSAKRPRRRDMASARSASALDEPVLAIPWLALADLWMGNAKGSANPGQSHRILYGSNYFWRVPEERPAALDSLEEFDAILESGAINEPARRLAFGERFERGNEGLLAKSTFEAAHDQAVGGAELARIQIVEKIGDERPISGPSRGRRQRPPGGRRDQNRGTRFRQTHARERRHRENRG